MDRRLPDADGDTLCEKIKALPGCADIPIIMITASILEREKQQPLFYNVLLNKPVQKVELLVALQSFLPLNESADVIAPAQMEKTAQTGIERSVDSKQLPKLLALLASYQDHLMQLGHSGGFQIYELIEIAERLLEIAEQFHCSLLFDWATALKSQAQLFDITNLAKTLKGFEALITKLNQPL